MKVIHTYKHRPPQSTYSDDVFEDEDGAVLGYPLDLCDEDTRLEQEQVAISSLLAGFLHAEPVLGKEATLTFALMLML